MIIVNHAFQEQTTFAKFQEQLQNVGKSETEFNKRLNNHRKNITRKDSRAASSQSDIEGYNFNTHAKFILIEQLHQTNMDTLIFEKRLEIKENFLILKLETLHPSLNTEMNKI